jgi:hypothetical protein
MVSGGESEKVASHGVLEMRDGVGLPSATADTVGMLQIKKHLGSGRWTDFITDSLRIRFDEIRAFP